MSNPRLHTSILMVWRVKGMMHVFPIWRWVLQHALAPPATPTTIDPAVVFCSFSTMQRILKAAE